MARKLWPLLIAFAACAACDDSSDTPAVDAAAVRDQGRIGDAERLDQGADRPDVAVLDAAPRPDSAPPVDDDATVSVDFGPGPELVHDIVTPGTPPDAPDRFSGVPEEQCDPGPTLIYPEPGTVFPRNIEGVELQWNAIGSVHLVRMQAGDLTVRWFTADDHLVPEGDLWLALKEAAVREGPITMHLVTLQPGRACATPPIDLVIDRTELKGAVYYWSTGDIGIMRLAQGDTAPEPFLNPQTAPLINCPACHALSRDGNRIAYTRTSFPPFGDMAAGNVEDPTTFLYDPQGVVGYFPSFAPDGDRVVAGAGGQLVVRSIDTGEQLGALPLPMMTVAGSPDWSWQGDRIAAALGPAGLFNPIPDVGISSGDIAQWHLVDDEWAMPEVLVEAGNDEWFDRPAYSPDGFYIAFNRIGPDPDAGQEERDNINPNSDLWILPAAGGNPVPLAHANQAALLGNSWPKWAVPTNRAGGRLWLAFSSLRRYGRHTGGDRPQIWITGVNPELAGEDPSAPAFWLPYQNTNSGNHIPYWAEFEKE